MNPISLRNSKRTTVYGQQKSPFAFLCFQAAWTLYTGNQSLMMLIFVQPRHCLSPPHRLGAAQILRFNSTHELASLHWCHAMPLPTIGQFVGQAQPLPCEYESLSNPWCASPHARRSLPASRFGSFPECWLSATFVTALALGYLGALQHACRAKRPCESSR
jgi:hypothetical protein